MKNLLIILLVLIANISWSQNCSSGEHSTNVADMWMSCSSSQNPNPAHGDSQWILYDLGFVYSLGTTHFWNFNETGNTQVGIKNVHLEYSEDGINWTLVETFLLNEAPGASQYLGEAGPNLADTDARYVLLTVIDTWGDPCAGISEVKFDIEGLISGNADVYADAQEIILFPNPTPGQFVIQGDLAGYNIAILNALGQVTQQLNTVSNEIVIDVSDLPNGLYFVSVKNNSSPTMFLEKILKQ